LGAGGRWSRRIRLGGEGGASEKETGREQA
jgi:hypothetical protein